ncbi:hypothetical protein SAMN04487967_0404 [Natronorubrum sediminis]|uniref:Uncharacterized protein n=1 Tax=Natronorubrum sediminis TaxID=640943 RepID=A0A1H6FL09_9EURY|nr:hypothetical protein [Natronorubrum sediminis]SEH11549.1 hypothetical protein SAMN04487967_0404 [Natronorubrum sediminis]
MSDLLFPQRLYYKITTPMTELVTKTVYRHQLHSEVTIENIFREYAVYDTGTGDGSVPGAWYVKYSANDNEVYIEPVTEFIDAIR